MGDTLWENFVRERRERSSLCNYNDGWCGDCERKWYEKEKEDKELEAIDNCIRDTIRGVIHSDYPDCTMEFLNRELKNRYEALPARVKEDMRQAWRKRYYEKFAEDVNWARKDNKFWDNSKTMREGAKAVFELAESKKTAAKTTAVEKELAESKKTAATTAVVKEAAVDATAEQEETTKEPAPPLNA